jgi:hypothetical protein
MPIRFDEYTTHHVEAVKAFNRRVSGTLDSELAFPENPVDHWLPKGGHPDIYQEAFLALEGEIMRGGYFLKHQPFSIHGEIHPVACYRLPVSEGVVNRSYASLGLQMMRDALARQPLLFSLGMGSLGHPLARMQKAAGWGQYAVPFRFRVIHGGRFLRQIAPLRTTAARQVLLDAAALTGAGSLGFMAMRLLRRPRLPSGISVERVKDFGTWADELWDRCRNRYSLIAVRNRDIANTLYPAGDGRFIRWRVSTGERLLGWAVCLDTAMHRHKQFGDMRVATIVDGLADPDDAGIVLAAVARELERSGADMVISNQMHAAWAQGLQAAGFFNGPSNYIFSASKELTKLLAPFEKRVLEGHINRGDGDGPIHL